MSDHRRNLAWLAGHTAQRAGKSRETCTREHGTIYFDDWHDGYSAAEQKPQPRTSESEHE